MKSHLGWAIALAFTLSGCGHAEIVNRAVVDMERVRTSPAVLADARLAPQAFARAEAARARAEKEEATGDPTAATIEAERASVAYEDARVLAELARATIDVDREREVLAQREARALTLATERAAADREADELETKLRAAHDALAPAASGHADPEREAARRVAARSLASEARLLCKAAELLSPSLEGLAAAEKDADAVDAELDAQKRGASAPIDGAARARASCLARLSHARRTSDPSPKGEPDALLSELSASGSWDPTRDERGVVVTLRDVFKGAALTPGAAKALAELGRVATAHPSFAVQVVVHDAAPPSAAESRTDLERARAVAAALVAAGAAEARVAAETAGARAPIVDPSDLRHRARNARVDVVFVSPVG